MDTVQQGTVSAMGTGRQGIRAARGGRICRVWVRLLRCAPMLVGLGGMHLRRYDMLNLTRPAYSRLLLQHLSRDAGGWGDPDQAQFKSPEDEVYRRLLDAIEEGAADVRQVPRMDMPGGRAIPQPREFGRVF